MGSKTNTTTQQQSTAPPADVLAQYQSLISRAQGVSQGATTAGPTGLQGQAWNAFGSIPGQYEGNALDAAGRAGAPIDQSQIQRYENPYQQDVTNATIANLNETNAQQSNQVKGNAIAQGALGGSREAVAQGELARQQGLANGQTLAGLNSANYSQALGAAGADRDAAARAAGLYGGLEANAAGVAGAQLGAGTQQQQLNQALLTQPYQQAQWLAQILGQVGPQEGGTTSGTQTTPAPSLLQQIAGLGVAGLGLAGGLGWKPFASAATSAIPGLYANGGAIPAKAGGGGIGNPSSRAHEMMQNALELARTMKAGIGGGDAFGGAVNPGIGVRGYDDGGGVFPSWMFDPTQATGDSIPGVDLLERGTGRVMSPASPSYMPPPLPAKNVDRVPLAPPTIAAVTPQTGIAANPEPLDMNAAGMAGTDANIHPAGAPPTQMAAGLNGGPGQPPIMLDPVSLGEGGPGGIAPRASVPYDTSGTSPQVLGGIAAQKAQSQGAPEWSLPLIAAGLGILASRSPNLGVAIGEGGLQGVNQLMSQRKQTFDQNLAQKDYDLKAKQLENQVSQFQQDYGIEKEKTDFEVGKPFPIGMDEFGRTQYGVRGPDGTIQTVAGGSGGTGTSAVKDIADGIVSGSAPPILTGLGQKVTPQVRAELSRRGFDLAKAQEDWAATQKLISTSGSVRFQAQRTALTQVEQSLPLLGALADEWDAGGFAPLNSVNMKAAQTGVYGQKAQSLAARFNQQLHDVIPELATIYKGGNTATDKSMEQASTQFSSDWSAQTFRDALKQVQENVRYRKNSLDSLSPQGVGGSNRYSQGNGTGPTTDTTSAASTPLPSGTTPEVARAQAQVQIMAHPDKKDAIIQRLKEYGVDTSGL